MGICKNWTPLALKTLNNSKTLFLFEENVVKKINYKSVCQKMLKTA